MKRCTALLLLTIALATPTATFASDRGELLYENHCQECHDNSVHTRKDRLVESQELLRAWVMSWTVHNGLDWSQEEVADITAYLNRAYYHFSD